MRSWTRVLTKMTDVTGDLFVVIDSTGKLVAKTKNFYVDYPLWMRSIEQGYCSDILMEYIEDRRRKNEYSLSDKPFTLFCEHMQRYLLCTRIVYDNFMMGYVIIVSKTGMFSAAEQQIIPLLSSSAKERIVRSNNGNWIDYRASQLNNIFADMLAGTQNVDMERRMKLAKLSFPEQKCLAIIRRSIIRSRLLQIPPHSGYAGHLRQDGLFGGQERSGAAADGGGRRHHHARTARSAGAVHAGAPADRRHQQLFSGQQPAFTPL